MSERSTPPLAATPLWATAVLTPTLWTPEQALAVLELLDELRDKVVSLYAGQIQNLLRKEQRVYDAAGDDNPSDDRPF